MVIKLKAVSVSKGLLIAYIVLSALFILMSTVNYMKNSVYNVGVQQGVGTTVNQIMAKSLNKKCEPFSVWSGEKEVSLINIACLQQANPQAQQGQAPQAGTPEITQ